MTTPNYDDILAVLDTRAENGERAGKDARDLGYTSAADDYDRDARLLREAMEIVREEQEQGWKQAYERLENEILRLSRQWDEHPEIEGGLYGGPCECRVCRSYD